MINLYVSLVLIFSIIIVFFIYRVIYINYSNNRLSDRRGKLRLPDIRFTFICAIGVIVMVALLTNYNELFKRNYYTIEDAIVWQTGKELNDSVYQEITYLYVACDNKELRLDGIEKLIHLSRLDLYQCQIHDLSKLETLHYLNTLTIIGGTIDLKLTHSLSNIKELTLSNAQLKDVLDINQFISLTKVSLINIDMNALTNVQITPTITDLEIITNNHLELTILEQFVNLEKLKIFYNKDEEFMDIPDPTPLSQLTKIKDLTLNRISLQNLDVLSDSLVTHLNLVDTKVVDVTALVEMDHLKDLSISKGYIIIPVDITTILESKDVQINVYMDCIQLDL